jgi:hypothetical protein
MVRAELSNPRTALTSIGAAGHVLDRRRAITSITRRTQEMDAKPYITPRLVRRGSVATDTLGFDSFGDVELSPPNPTPWYIVPRV